MNTDNQKIKELIGLSDENPDLPIITMVATEIVAEDSFKYWLGSIGRIEKDILWQNDEYVSIGYDEIFYDLSCNFENDPENEDLSDEDFKKIIDADIQAKKECKEIYEAIIVYIELP